MSDAVSGALARFGLSKLRVPTWPGGLMFNGAGRAGPRRPALIFLAMVLIVTVVGAIALSGRHAPVLSKDAKLMNVDPLPGGLHSTKEQDALALAANDAAARQARDQGVSFTPPMWPSRSALPPPPQVEQAASRAPDPHAATFMGRPRPEPRAIPAPLQAAFPVPLRAPDMGPQLRPTQVAAPAVDQQAEQAYSKQIDDMFSQWGGRVPRTDVLLPPGESDGVAEGGAAAESRPSTTAGARDAASGVAVSARAEDTRILVPAGRGVYAHPILALSSDQSSPVVLQADSGPIAGDRMIGTFAKQADRLVIHVGTIIHNGESIGVDGVVTAPDTMEAAVASNVDEHYLTRFILPAAAAFVQGLGQALATTSNTTSVLSPLGGATTSTNLNFRQQLGVAAGVSASQIATTLNQEAPKGPTVSLEVNVAVGVMFLSNVTSHQAP